jgi:hypothetical protein
MLDLRDVLRKTVVSVANVSELLKFRLCRVKVSAFLFQAI